MIIGWRNLKAWIRSPSALKKKKKKYTFREGTLRKKAK